MHVPFCVSLFHLLFVMHKEEEEDDINDQILSMSKYSLLHERNANVWRIS